STLTIPSDCAAGRWWFSLRCCRSSPSRILRPQNFLRGLRERVSRLRKIVQAENGDFEQTLTEIPFPLERRPPAAAQIPFASIGRPGSDTVVLLNAEENQKPPADLLQFVRTKIERHPPGPQLHDRPRPAGIPADR